MAFTFSIPVGRDGFNIQLGATPDGRPDIGFGMRQYQVYGNGYNTNEFGYSTGRGVFANGDSAYTNGWQTRSNSWGIDAWGSRNSNTYSDVWGNYQNNRYASNVFGGVYAGQTTANPWGYRDQNYMGNVWGGGVYYGSGGPALGGWFGY